MSGPASERIHRLTSMFLKRQLAPVATLKRIEPILHTAADKSPLVAQREPIAAPQARLTTGRHGSVDRGQRAASAAAVHDLPGLRRLQADVVDRVDERDAPPAIR
jgi:hypothetical protein